MLVGGDAVGRLAVGQEPTTATTTIFSVANGTFTETGEAVTFETFEPVAAASFTHTGEPTNLQQQTPSAFGSFSLTGEFASFQESIASAFGSFSLTGEGQNFQTSDVVSFGSFVLTGQSASFGFGPLFITDTDLIELPINCVLVGQQDYEVGPTEIESRDPAIKTRITVSQGSGGRIGGENTFRARTDSKGYD